MKFIPSQLAELLDDGEVKTNLGALFRFLAILATTIVISSVLFHEIMELEGKEYSWITGFYWTLTTMSTLGFGDITFESDLGRFFSVVVLLYGIVMLLIVAPFAFIRWFYAPWLEAQIRMRAPRKLPKETEGHVIICGYDMIAQGLVERLDELGIPYVILEPDVTEAAARHVDGLNVVAGPRDLSETYVRVRADRARLVLANRSDTENTAIAITVRQVAPDLPIVAFADHHDSVDVLELAGASHVIPLKQRLGEQLATRVTAGIQTAHRIGRFEDLIIAEFPIHGTGLVGRTIRDTNLRQLTGLNVVGVWERGRLEPAGPDTVLHEHSVPVVVGTDEQVTDLDALFVIYQETDTPVLVIGGGTVGRAVSQALRSRGAKVTILDSDPSLRDELSKIADRVVIGDAANLQTVKAAGIEEAPSVVLTTNSDETNLFLSVYCRGLSSDGHIVSRISHDWNLEAIHRAGADFALSRASLAVQTLVSMILGRELVVVGEGTELFVEPIPRKLAGRSLADSEIGAATGLNVIGIRAGGVLTSNPAGATVLPAGGELVMIGTSEQRQRFLALTPR
ncbi:MAG: potassium channel family protein [Myxococcota bacterium]